METLSYCKVLAALYAASDSGKKSVPLLDVCDAETIDRSPETVHLFRVHLYRCSGKRRGLVLSKKDPDDRRRRLYSITPWGIERLKWCWKEGKASP